MRTSLHHSNLLKLYTIIQISNCIAFVYIQDIFNDLPKFQEFLKNFKSKNIRNIKQKLQIQTTQLKLSKDIMY